MTENGKTETWAIVEIMGHKRIAGKVSEEVKFGVPMMRVDVPETKTRKPFVRYFGGSSIHSFTPMGEADVRRAAEWLDESPSILPGVIESPWLVGKNTEVGGLLPDDYDPYPDDGDDLVDCDEDEGFADCEDDEPGLPVAMHNIVSMERDKTKNSESPMWRCVTADDKKVNVFKHKDSSKNTFRFFEAAGYAPLMELMKVGDVLTWKEYPIQVELDERDGWLNVAHVYAMPVGAKPEIGRDDAKAKAEAAAWARAIVELYDFVVLDTETTGLDKQADVPLSIAVIDSKGDVLLDTLVNTTQDIDAEASAIHGITADKLKDAPYFSEIREKLLEITARKHVVVFNAEFDLAMVRNANGSTWISDALRWTCAMEQYAKFYGDWNPHHANYKNQSLGKALDQQGIELVGAAHSAVDDCRATLALIKKMAAYDPHPF